MGRLGTAVALALLLTSGAGAADEVRLPRVVSAAVPLYRADARSVEGTVRLLVITDGERVSEVKVESGIPILAELATANVRTWRMTRHLPTAFRSVFTYRLVRPATCADESETVTLRLPREVEISVRPTMICDPGSRDRTIEP